VVSDLIDAYGPSVAFLGLQGGSYEIPWTAARRAYYPFQGYPTYMIDGILDSWHGSPPWNYWDDDTDARLAIPTDVTLALSAVQGAGPEIWELTATVCIEAGGVGKSMRVYLAEILDGYPAAVSYFHRNGLRQVAATEDIVLAPDGCTDVVRTFTLDATSMASIENVSFVGWAQDDLPSGLAEVYQARQLSWPFSVDDIFADDFESADTGQWSTVVP
jgi:hypothetical protein